MLPSRFLRQVLWGWLVSLAFWPLQAAAESGFTTPEWVKDAVFYQVFPERYCNGDPSNDPPSVLPWGAPPQPKGFHGGDLAGLTSRLDTLAELGVNAVYLNPIFKASTNHKYNTTDYLQIDPAFGTTETLKRLVQACHTRGIRVVLDGVFNHVGTDFGPFQDVVRNGTRSRYRDWFFIKSFPIRTTPEPNYACWWNIGELPKLNTHNAEVRDYLFKVARYWIQETGIDGWRLDVAEEIPHNFWVEFRQQVKSVKPDAYVVGEIWHEAQPWLRGDQFDAVMNYPLREAIFQLTNLGTPPAKSSSTSPSSKASAFWERISHLHTSVPKEVAYAQLNLLGSHDTERLLTLAGGDRRKVELATALQMTLPGAPMVYYGDEIGLEGGKDPDCRRCYPWDGPQDRTLRNRFQALIAFRHQHPATRRGSLLPLPTLHGQPVACGFERRLGDERVRVVCNPSASPARVVVPLEYATENSGTIWQGFHPESTEWTVRPGSMETILPAYGYDLLVAKDPQKARREP